MPACNIHRRNVKTTPDVYQIHQRIVPQWTFFKSVLYRVDFIHGTRHQLIKLSVENRRISSLSRV